MIFVEVIVRIGQEVREEVSKDTPHIRITICSLPLMLSTLYSGVNSWWLGVDPRQRGMWGGG